MEYIQCPHCQKKYGVNEKVRAASGKTIKCKGCAEPFEIVIFSTPAAPETTSGDTPESGSSNENNAESKVPSFDERNGDEADPESSEAEDQTSDDESPKATPKKEKESSKPKPVQLIFAGLLSLVLVAGLLFTYQLMTTPQTVIPIKRSATVVKTPPPLPEVMPTPQTVSQPKDKTESQTENPIENEATLTDGGDAQSDELPALPELDLSDDILQREAEKLLESDFEKELNAQSESQTGAIETVTTGQQTEEVTGESVEELSEEASGEQTAAQELKIATQDGSSNIAPNQTAAQKKPGATDPMDNSLESDGENEATGSTSPIPDPNLGPENPSEACKQVAADQWMIDFMITHGNVSGEEYIRLLDDSSNKTEEVRSICQSRYLAGSIAEAAKKDMKPEWIRAEIDARTSLKSTTGIERKW